MAPEAQAASRTRPALNFLSAIGAKIDFDGYPLTCKFISRIDSPEELEVAEDSLCDDTSSWWDNYYDEGDP